MRIATMLRLFALILPAVGVAEAQGGVSVSGRVVRADSQPSWIGSSVELASVGAARARSIHARLARDGSFTFTNVPPGIWDAIVERLLPAVRVVVGDTNITTLRLPVPRKVRVNGVMRVENGGLRPVTPLIFTHIATNISERVSARAAFWGELYAGEYRVTVPDLPPGYTIRSLTAGTVDLMAQPLQVQGDSVQVDLVLTASSPPPWVSVSGRLTGGTPAIYAATTLVYYGSVIGEGRTLSTTVNTDGSFRIPMALPGTYEIRLGRGYTEPPSFNGAPAISLGVGTRDLTDVRIPVPVSKTVQGRLMVEGNGPMAPSVSFLLDLGYDNLSGLGADGWTRANVGALNPGTVVITPLRHVIVSARVRPDGSFTVTLPAGDEPRQFQLNEGEFPAGFALRSVRYGAANLLIDRMSTATTDTATLVITFRAGAVR